MQWSILLVSALIILAAALILSARELILNLSGFFFRRRSNLIAVGDRIEINGIRGDVIDQSWTGVTLLEIGSGVKTHQYTGLTTFVPNSMFLIQAVKNESRMLGDYVFHIITVTLAANADWRIAEKALMRAANEICAPYLDEARRNMKALAEKHGLDSPSAEPRINVRLGEPDKISLSLRLPVPTRRRGRLEQKITRKYLEYLEEAIAEEMRMTR